MLCIVLKSYGFDHVDKREVVVCIEGASWASQSKKENTGIVNGKEFVYRKTQIWTISFSETASTSQVRLTGWAKMNFHFRTVQ